MMNKDVIFHGSFFEKFIIITHYQTLIGILAILVCFYILKKIQDKKFSFSIRMLVGLGFGIILGLGIQYCAGFPEKPTIWMQEIGTWYGLVGRSFIAFIRMLVIPLIFVSIVKVIIDFANKHNLTKIAFKGIFWLLFTTAIACLLGVILASIFKLGQSGLNVDYPVKNREFSSLVDTFVNLVPRNIIAAMNNENIVGLVIFSSLLGIAANRMEKKSPEIISVFKSFIQALYKIVMSIAMTIIKYMPYAIIAMLAGTIISKGIPAIIAVSSFVFAIYVAMILMLCIHLLIIVLHGISPIIYLKKALGVWLMAFTSRSSVGSLPMTISTLTHRMGVSSGTANLVSSLGSTMGMNGCAGFYPAMIAVMVAHMVGIQIDIQFYVMLLIVVVIGSIGIAGIPGTAMVASTVVLTGMGMGEYFSLIGMVLAIDPIIDMARTLANVSGAMTSAVVTDRELGIMNMDVFNDPKASLEENDED
ncbi:cation:dicarboxylase symporter family transporter [Orbaceae bacterium ac157xtp]